MTLEEVRVGGREVSVETFGERGAPPVLLLARAEDWPPDVCRRLAVEGRFVIRYEQADDELVPDTTATTLVDVLAGGRAHVVGSSAGEVLARRLAVQHPERVATLTLISTGREQIAAGVGVPTLVINATRDEIVPAVLRHTDHRVRFASLFEEEARAHDERFRAAIDIGPHDRVLDIGCGTGGTTREAARAAVAGSALGVDISSVAIEEARRLSEVEGLSNVAYLRADAQVHPFAPGQVDVCISRFGVMFFADPVAAFTNIGAALRRGARLVLLVWQTRDHDEASGAIDEALGAAPDVAGPAGPHAYSLGDPATTKAVLAAAGFTDVTLEDVHEPICYGPDAATAEQFVLGLRDTRERLAAIDPAGRDEARGRLRALFAAHETTSGVLFDGRTWVVTARRP